MFWRPTQFAHWHQFFDNIPISPLEFYKSIDTELAQRKIPETTVAQVEFLERGLLSSKRIYLQIERDWLTYHICVAPFGTGFFVSSRLIVWPWRSWTTLAVIIEVVLFLLFICFVVYLGVTGNVISAILGSACWAIPVGFFLILVIISWYFFCKYLSYYRQDTMLAFHEAVHGLLVTRVNSVIEASGRKPLSVEESKPILHKLLAR